MNNVQLSLGIELPTLLILIQLLLNRSAARDAAIRLGTLGSNQ